MTIAQSTASDSRRQWIAASQILLVGLAALTLALVLRSAPSLFEQLQSNADARLLEDLGITADGYALYLTGLNLLVVFAHLVIAGLIFYRRRYEPMALAVCSALVANGAIIPLSTVQRPANLPLVEALVSLIIYVGLVSGVSILYLFPDGRFVPRWTRWLALGWAIFSFAVLYATPPEEGYQSEHFFLQATVILLVSAVGVFAQSYRYFNVSSAEEKQQTKWAIFGLVAAVLGPISYFIPFVVYPSLAIPDLPNMLYGRVGPTFFSVFLVSQLGWFTVRTVLFLLPPIFFAIAILRFRLWDIDVIIRRTVVYGALTIAVVIMYLVTVIGLTGVLQALTGEGDQIAIVGSTLLIAAVFNPLRRRIQVGVDRRFFREDYDAAVALNSFGESIRDEVDLRSMQTALLSTVQETMQPNSVSLWMREEMRPGFDRG